jgi:hypothetical protein
MGERALVYKQKPGSDPCLLISKNRDLTPVCWGSDPCLLNWFRAKKQFSSGIVEGFNTKAKLTTRKAHGFKTFHAVEIALYHALGALPVPKTTHVFF